LLLSGFRDADRERWEIGIQGIWQRATDPSQVVLELPKPTSHPKGDRPWTEHWFNQEAVWLLQAHVFYGGVLRVMGSKHNGYYYPAVGIGGMANVINVDRLIGGCGPYQDARKVKGTDYHDHTRESIRPTSDRKVAAEVGRENERSTGKVTREAAMHASLSLWRPSKLFPTLDAYDHALRGVYAVLDRLHPLPSRAT